MTYDTERLRRIFDKTQGKCHICGKKLARKNYGRAGERGAWEVEHSNPRAAGGTDNLHNLYAAHVSCNRAKPDGSTQAARAQHGRTRAPLSARAERVRRLRNAATAALFSGIGWRLLLGPGGVIAGVVAGVVAYSRDPD